MEENRQFGSKIKKKRIGNKKVELEINKEWKKNRRQDKEDIKENGRKVWIGEGKKKRIVG